MEKVVHDLFQLGRRIVRRQTCCAVCSSNSWIAVTATWQNRSRRRWVDERLRALVPRDETVTAPKPAIDTFRMGTRFPFFKARPPFLRTMHDATCVRWILQARGEAIVELGCRPVELGVSRSTSAKRYTYGWLQTPRILVWQPHLLLRQTILCQMILP